METAADIGFELGTVDLGAGYGSDHIAFMLAGIDVIFLFADDVTYINSPLDTLEHLQPEPLAQSVELTLEIDRAAGGAIGKLEWGGGYQMGWGWDRIVTNRSAPRR